MITHAQDYEEAGSSSAPRPNMDVGQFPFQRGERAVFSFDQGDEVSINTFSIDIMCIYFHIFYIFPGFYSDHYSTDRGSGQN